MCAVTTLFGSCLCENGDFYEILGRRVADDSFLFFTAFVIYISLEPSLWLVVGGLFEDVGDLAEIFFVGVGGSFEDGGLRDYLFAN